MSRDFLLKIYYILRSKGVLTIEYKIIQYNVYSIYNILFSYSLLLFNTSIVKVFYIIFFVELILCRRCSKNALFFLKDLSSDLIWISLSLFSIRDYCAEFSLILYSLFCLFEFFVNKGLLFSQLLIIIKCTTCYKHNIIQFHMN